MNYMKYQEFIETVKEHIKQQVQKTVYIYPVLKNNGAVYDGLIILDPLLNITPTIYLNPYYHRYLDGVSMEDIYDDILQTYHDNLPDKDFDISNFEDYSKASENIVMKLINADKNKELLDRVPHILIYDLAIVFLYCVNDFVNEHATILIYNNHIKLWNVNVDTLFESAKQNSPIILPPRLDNLYDVFKHITNESQPFLEEMNICILTNYLKIHGATCLVYPNLMKKIADIFEDDIVIIPSSIHELLIFPSNALPEGQTMEHINEMIQNVNETQLTDSEILSDHVYYYYRETDTIVY